LFYEANTIVLQTHLSLHVPLYLQELVVRLYIRGDMNNRLVKDLQECSNLTHLALSPSRAPNKRLARSFPKPGKLSQIIVEDREGFRYAEEWRNFINSD
jgi:hypothetical protein